MYIKLHYSKGSKVAAMANRPKYPIYHIYQNNAKQYNHRASDVVDILLIPRIIGLPLMTDDVVNDVVHYSKRPQNIKLMITLKQIKIMARQKTV